MYHRFVIYPEGIEKLTAAGLLEKVAASRFTSRFVNEEDLQQLLVEAAAFAPAEFVPRLRAAMDRQETHPWVVHVPEAEQYSLFGHDVQHVELTLEDFDVLSGDAAATVLCDARLLRFSEFGFDSYAALVGTVGAYAQSLSAKQFNPGHVWESEYEGKRYRTEVTGSFHGDFRLQRIDITPYPTLDPLGFAVPYRPLLPGGSAHVAGSHSIEPYVLASILKYVEQTGVPSRIGTASGAEQFLHDTEALGSALGNFADAGNPHIGGVRSTQFQLFMPMGDEDSEKSFDHFVPLYAGSGHYEIVIGPKNELVFRLHGGGANEVRIPPAEIDELAYGLFVQASRGLGRTAVYQLREVLQYRYSDEFVAERDEFSRK